MTVSVSVCERPPTCIPADKEEAGVYNKAQAKVADVWIDYSLPDPDGCEDGVTCPVAAGSTGIKETVSLKIPTFAPEVSQWSSCPVTFLPTYRRHMYLRREPDQVTL